MASAKDQQTNTHHIILPECASDFSSHDNCPHVVQSITGATIICACVACHGTPQTVEKCAGCGKPKTVEVVDTKITAGERVREESYILRYCGRCREAFEADMRAARR